MANLNPFLSQPGEWVEQLVLLREERKKIEEREEHLREKLLEHMAKKGVESVEGDQNEARLEERSSVDFSQKALGEVYGQVWLEKAKAALPQRTSKTLRVGKKRSAKVQEIQEFFGKERGVK